MSDYREEEARAKFAADVAKLTDDELMWHVHVMQAELRRRRLAHEAAGTRPPSGDAPLVES